MAASGTEPHGEREPRGGEACAVLRGGPVEGSDAPTRPPAMSLVATADAVFFFYDEGRVESE